MRISHAHRFIFFSNPRTGSTSLRAFLTEISDFKGAQVPLPPAQPFHDHMRPIEARDAFARLGLDYGRYYKFVVVRNPWRRVASTYAMIRTVCRDFTVPFVHWLETVKPHGPGGGGSGSILETWRQYGTYTMSAFAGDGSGALFVDDVFRLEDIDSISDKLRRRGLPIPPDAKVGVRNRTGGSVDYCQLYATRRSRDIVGDLYADDIRKYRYRFPN